MKKLFYAISLLSATIFSIACNKIKPEGNIVTETKEIATSISKIDVSNVMTLLLTDNVAIGEVVISAHENIYNDYLNVKTSDNELEIYLDSNNYSSDVDITIQVSSSQFSSIEASGASNATIEGLPAQFQDYEIELSGASRFKGEIDCNTLGVEMSGASYLNLTGTAAQTVAIDASGASSFDSTYLTTADLEVELSGASNVIISVTNSISGKLSGASTVNYLGSGVKVDVSTSGSSSVNNVNNANKGLK
ncbi:MAG: DUF2807 domain-containing protein [Rikenellaceae bacterium]